MDSELVKAVAGAKEKRLRAWGGRYAEGDDCEPIFARDAKPGAICRHWFMPNKIAFVVLGCNDDLVALSHQGGTISRINGCALLVEVIPAPAGFMDMSRRIQKFEKRVWGEAWAGRLVDAIR